MYLDHLFTFYKIHTPMLFKGTVKAWIRLHGCANCRGSLFTVYPWIPSRIARLSIHSVGAEYTVFATEFDL